jgi:hypothetical protein
LYPEKNDSNPETITNPQAIGKWPITAQVRPNIDRNNRLKLPLADTRFVASNRTLWALTPTIQANIVAAPSLDRDILITIHVD